ncbi:hypothetical protein EDB92DRAFT_1940537 [Lactarius akahatsu]|uniref:CCHC-type domain-containing protein n=1 Tax=Lactarius akahatsu TaxID=416441 RepID=A0AAD4LQD2_9AGAM|nr:hypothetical protein EDB92DRAFT_1940537 [Lactarius akahatsu]
MSHSLLLVLKILLCSRVSTPPSIVASLQLVFPEDDSWVEVFRRFSDDLPEHVLGAAYWNTSPVDPRGGYRCVVDNRVHLIEFINHAWYIVERHFNSELGLHIHRTRNSLRIERENPLGLGWWSSEDENNPERLPPATAPVQTEEPIEQIEEDVQLDSTLPDPVEELTEAFRRLTLVHTDPPYTLPIFSATPPVTPMAAAPLTGALKGVTPTTFAGDRAESEQFLDHALVQKPFLRVVLALGFIKGSAVNDWVDMISRKLEASTTRTTNRILETDEVLWTDFETEFRNAWTDTLSKQAAYQQLTTLKMKGDSVDEYIATFERLANVADWHRDANGTIEFFRRGLTESIHRACLARTTMPKTMTEWQTAARAEAQRARTIASSFGSRRARFDPFAPPFTTQANLPKQNDVVPMEVDAITTSRRTILSTLSDAEYARCQKEGRCFKCTQTGHQTKDCPDRRKTNTRINEVTTSPPGTPSNAQSILQAALTLRPEEREHIINTMALANLDYNDDSPRAQINNLDIASPTPHYPQDFSFASSSPLSLSRQSTAEAPWVAPFSAAFASSLSLDDTSPAASPTLTPLTSHFLNTLALDDEFPPLPNMFSSYISRPASPIITNDDIWYPAEEGADDVWASLLSPPAPRVRVEDDTRLSEGVKSSISAVPATSTPRYAPLFPRGALERPKDPDLVMPTTTHAEEEEPKRMAIMPHNHPLYTHIRRKRGSGSDADDKRPHKKPRPQLARRTKPLPKYVDYRLRPEASKREIIKVGENSSDELSDRIKGSAVWAEHNGVEGYFIFDPSTRTYRQIHYLEDRRLWAFIDYSLTEGRWYTIGPVPLTLNTGPLGPPEPTGINIDPSDTPSPSISILTTNLLATAFPSYNMAQLGQASASTTLTSGGSAPGGSGAPAGGIPTSSGGGGGGGSGGGGGGGGGGSGGSGPAPAGGLAPAPGGNGRLGGNPPPEFDGSREKSKAFLRAFKLYCGMNPTVDLLAVPGQRAMAFLSYIRGPLVDDWVDEQMRWLEAQIVSGVPRTQNNLWNEVETRFLQAYTDTTEQTKARKALQSLAMKGEDIDSYIAQFDNLVAKAGYGPDEATTLELFQDGLPNQLVINAIRFQHPITWEDWKRAARLQQAEYLGGHNRDQWVQALNKNRDPNSMDIGRARASVALTDADRVQLQKEGRCFRCRATGHISHNCPQKNARIANSSTTIQSTPIVTPATMQTPAVTTVAMQSNRVLSAEEQAEVQIAAMKAQPQEVRDLMVEKLFAKEDFLDA